MGTSSLYNKINKINNVKLQKITASNIKAGVNIFGVNGTYTSDANAWSSDIANGKTAYVNGRIITGSVNEYNAETTNIPFESLTDDPDNQMLHQTYNIYTNISEIDNRKQYAGNALLRDEAYTNITYNSISSLLNIQGVNIKKGAKILDIEGQYDASTEFSGIKMDPVLPSNTSTSLTSSIREVSGLDMTNGTNLGNYFFNLQGLMLVSNITAPNVTNLYCFCFNCCNLTNFSYVNFYNEEQQDICCYNMFSNCVNLSSMINVQFPKSINNAYYMFSNCGNLINIPGVLNVSATNKVMGMFYNCSNLTTINNIQFNTEVNVDMSSLFANCTNLDVSNLNFVNVKTNSTDSIFSNVKSITDESVINILSQFSRFYVENSAFKGTSLTKIPDFTNIMNGGFGYYYNINSLFQDCQNITNIDYTMFTNIRGINRIFQNCQNLKTVNLTIGNDVSYMESAFSNCINLQNVNLYLPNNTTINTIETLFQNCQNLNTVNLYGNNITLNETRYAFQNCQNLKTIDLSKLIFEYVNSASYMFANCYSLTNIGITSINLLDNCNYINSMFQNCYNLSQPISMNIIAGRYGNSLNNMFASSGFTSINLNYDINTNYYVRNNVYVK